MSFTSRVERVISAGHYAGPDGHRCRTQHGHDFKIVVEMTYTHVDPKTGWGPDFGAIKKIIDMYDHQNLNDEEPFAGNLLGIPASSENLARVLYEEIWQNMGIPPDFVKVYEGKGNSVKYTGPDYRARGTQS